MNRLVLYFTDNGPPVVVIPTLLLCYFVHTAFGGFHTKKHMRTVRGFYQVPPKEVQ